MVPHPRVALSVVLPLVVLPLAVPLLAVLPLVVLLLAVLPPVVPLLAVLLPVVLLQWAALWQQPSP